MYWFWCLLPIFGFYLGSRHDIERRISGFSFIVVFCYSLSINQLLLMWPWHLVLPFVYLLIYMLGACFLDCVLLELLVLTSSLYFLIVIFASCLCILPAICQASIRLLQMAISKCQQVFDLMFGEPINLGDYSW